MFTLTKANKKPHPIYVYTNKNRPNVCTAATHQKHRARVPFEFRQTGRSVAGLTERPFR